jgi:hypothetical protein
MYWDYLSSSKACPVMEDMEEIPPIPLLSVSLGEPKLEGFRRRIKTDIVDQLVIRGFIVVFRISSFEPAQYVRAIQELEMLKTKVAKYDKTTRNVVTLLSFVEVWNSDKFLRALILISKDPQEAKWQLQQTFDYKLATNFMPMYARSIYEYFKGTRVLDGCAGWGDRMAGALSTGTVRKYVGFDPNSLLIHGYTKIQNDFGFEVTSKSDKTIEFNSNYKIHTVVFEEAEQYLADEKFDLAFTGPPFFDYENYGTHMPSYTNWIEQFYKPLFQITHDHLDENGIFAVYLNDTISGKIETFMTDVVPTFTTFKYSGKVGIVGGSSNKTRDIFIFRRGS